MSTVESALITQDPDALRVLQRILDDLKIGVEHHTDVEQMLQRLSRWRFDAVLVDCDGMPGGVEVLTQTRQGRNRKAITFAIVNGTTSAKTCFQLGANFVVDKPLSFERTTRLLRTAHGLILRERIRYIRQEAGIPVHLSFGSVTDFPATLDNLSEGGMGIKVTEAVVIAGLVRFQFRLDGAMRAIDGKAEVVWSDAEGRAGLRFTQLDPASQKKLIRWLTERLDPRAFHMVLSPEQRQQKDHAMRSFAVEKRGLAPAPMSAEREGVLAWRGASF